LKNPPWLGEEENAASNRNLSNKHENECKLKARHRNTLPSVKVETRLRAAPAPGHARGHSTARQRAGGKKKG